MKRVLLLLVAALGLFLVGRAAVRAFVSDETRIRWILEDLAEGFDRTRMDPVLVAFAEDFRDETSGADRRSLREGLAYLFVTAKDPQSKAFPYRVEIEIGRLAVDRAGPGPRTAECDVRARFLERRGGEESLAWQIEIAARWRKGDYGWRIVGTRHDTESGRMIR